MIGAPSMFSSVIDWKTFQGLSAAAVPVIPPVERTSSRTPRRNPPGVMLWENSSVVVTNYLETWAQPDAADLHGNEIESLPPGLNLATLRRHQIFTLNGAGADNQFQLTNVGNELRCMILVVRDSNGARQDFLSDPIRWRLDNRSLGVFSPDEVFNQMNDFYDALSSGTSQRPTGVYVWPRFYQPGQMKGQSWLGTTNATYLIWETATTAGATNVPGTVEVITDEVVPVGAVPMELESI